MEKEEREDTSYQACQKARDRRKDRGKESAARIERESGRRKRGREAAILIASPRPAKNPKNGADSSRKLNTPGTENEKMAQAPQSEQLAGTPETARQKEKEQNPYVQITTGLRGKRMEFFGLAERMESALHRSELRCRWYSFSLYCFEKSQKPTRSHPTPTNYVRI